MDFKDFVIAERHTGCIVASGRSPKPEMQETSFEKVYLGEGTPETHWIENDKITERPLVIYPSSSYDLTQLPDGTVITLRNEANDVLVITDLSGTLTLSDPGMYRFEIDPPFPWQKQTINFEVLS